MDSKVKCVALDLDGTLLSDEKKVSEENREALMRAAEKGVHIVIASGRPIRPCQKKCCRYLESSTRSLRTVRKSIMF